MYVYIQICTSIVWRIVWRGKSYPLKRRHHRFVSRYNFKLFYEIYETSREKRLKHIFKENLKISVNVKRKNLIGRNINYHFQVKYENIVYLYSRKKWIIQLNNRGEQLESKAHLSRKISVEFSSRVRNRSPRQQGCDQRNKSYIVSAFHGGAALRRRPGQLIPLVQVVHQVRRSNVYTSRQRRLTNTPRLSFLSPRIPRGVSSDPNPESCHSQ